MYWLAVMLIAATSGAYAQLTAQSSVAPDLRECYMNATLVNRNNLPPATMPVLIDIIRKIEDNPNYLNLGLRQIAVLLLHTYRQDGIEFHQPDISMGVATNVLPYAPTFHSFHRHRLLLTRIIPSNSQIFANDTLTSDLKCAIHYMLSTTVDAKLRGDENRCNQLSQYRALRTGRQAPSFDDDVEILDPALLNLANRNGQIRQYNPNDDVDFNGYVGSRSERQLMGESQCPLLGGVVNSPWGAVSAGHLIAGIAAGSESQQVPVVELTKSSVNYNNVQSSVTSIYPATLSGDLAEASLIQGTERGSTSISIGATGGWNSTQAPRFYMLQSRINLEMTDPEIRGDVDGFVLGSTLSTSQSVFGSLKLSQLLDMYYSPRNGVFNPSLRACNRRELSQTYVTESTLASETYAFAAALDTNIPLRGTITSGLDQLVSSAVTNFQTYMNSNMNDMNCITTESTSRDFRMKTNLFLVLDASWQYQVVYPAISFLLDAIEVSKYGSSITLMSAFDGSVVINTTFSLADFHNAYTIQRHQSMLNGVNLENTLTNIRTAMHNRLENERIANYIGGNSTVLLFLLNNGNVQSTPQIWEQARILNETVPDLRILFATSTNQFDHLWNLVRDMHDDVLTISLSSEGTNVESTMNPVLSRIHQVGRRIINPMCGANYTEQAMSGSRHFDDFIEPGYANFYSVSPNYFTHNTETTKIRILRSTAGSFTLVVCHSRTVRQPRQNSTSTGVDENVVTCQSLANSGSVEISLRNACDGYSTINSCPLLYVSVQATGTQAATTASCSDNACRFPYNIRYQVHIEDLSCRSSAAGVGASVLVIVTAFFLTVFKLL